MRNEPPSITGWVRRTLLFEDWTWMEPTEARHVRASWPRWRRTVRPVGAVAWWSVVLLGISTQSSRHALIAVRTTQVALLVLVVAAIAIGVVDGVRRRASRRTA